MTVPSPSLGAASQLCVSPGVDARLQLAIEQPHMKAHFAVQPAGSIVAQCRTLDQARAVVTFLDAALEKTLRATVALTAARGRGKSAAVGLAIAGSLALGYSNIFVTAPSPENLRTLFDFILKVCMLVTSRKCLTASMVISIHADKFDGWLCDALWDFVRSMQYLPAFTKPARQPALSIRSLPVLLHLVMLACCFVHLLPLHGLSLCIRSCQQAWCCAGAGLPGLQGAH